MKRMLNFRWESLPPWRLGIIVAAAVVPLLVSDVFHRAMRAWSFASEAMRWSMICGCAAVALLALITYAESLLADTRERAVREERERMARELHDTLVQSCASVSMMLEAIASTSVAQSDLLHQAREHSRQTVEEARKTISSLRHGSGDIDLITVLHGVADEIRHSSGKSLQVKQNVARLFVSASSADEISMTVREALRNAVRHSGSERMTMELKSRRESLSICVRDYGCGIPENAATSASGHFGLLGMHERMRRVGGGIDVQAAPGGGTSVQLVVRVGHLRRASLRA